MFSFWRPRPLPRRVSLLPRQLLKQAQSHAPQTSIPIFRGIWSNATRTPFERPAVFNGRPAISDEEARTWEAKENERWEEGSKIDGGRPVTIQGGAYNVLFYDNGNEMMRIDGQKRTSMVVDPPDGHVPPLAPEARDRVRRRTYVPRRL